MEAPFFFEQFLKELRDSGVSLWIEEPNTLVVWPSDRVSPEQVLTLKVNKPAIIAAHRRRMIDLLPSAEVCDQWRAKYCNTPCEPTP